MTREELKALRAGDLVWPGGRGSVHEVKSRAWEWGEAFLAGPKTRCGTQVRDSWSLLSQGTHMTRCRVCHG